MATPQPISDPSRNVSRVTGRVGLGLAAGKSHGLNPVRSGERGGPSSGEVWVVVEAEADIAAKGHPYISFDPAGTYP